MNATLHTIWWPASPRFMTEIRILSGVFIIKREPQLPKIVVNVPASSSSSVSASQFMIMKVRE